MDLIFQFIQRNPLLNSGSTHLLVDISYLPGSYFEVVLTVGMQHSDLKMAILVYRLYFIS